MSYKPESEPKTVDGYGGIRCPACGFVWHPQYTETCGHCIVLAKWRAEGRDVLNPHPEDRLPSVPQDPDGSRERAAVETAEETFGGGS